MKFNPKWNRCDDCYDSNEYLKSHLDETDSQHVEWTLSLNLDKRRKVNDDYFFQSFAELTKNPEIMIISVLLMMLSILMFFHLKLWWAVKLQTHDKDPPTIASSTSNVPMTPLASYSIKHRFIQQPHSPTIEPADNLSLGLSPIENSDSPTILTYSPCNMLFSGSIVGSDNTCNSVLSSINMSKQSINSSSFKPMSQLASQLFDSDSEQENIHPNVVAIRASRSIKALSPTIKSSFQSTSDHHHNMSAISVSTPTFSTPRKHTPRSQSARRVLTKKSYENHATGTYTFTHGYHDDISLSMYSPSSSPTSSSSSSPIKSSPLSESTYSVSVKNKIISSPSIKISSSPCSASSYAGKSNPPSPAIRLSPSIKPTPSSELTATNIPTTSQPSSFIKLSPESGSSSTNDPISSSSTIKLSSSPECSSPCIGESNPTTSSLYIKVSPLSVSTSSDINKNMSSTSPSAMFGVAPNTSTLVESSPHHKHNLSTHINTTSSPASSALRRFTSPRSPPIDNFHTAATSQVHPQYAFIPMINGPVTSSKSSTTTSYSSRSASDSLKRHVAHKIIMIVKERNLKADRIS